MSIGGGYQDECTTVSVNYIVSPMAAALGTQRAQPDGPAAARAEDPRRGGFPPEPEHGHHGRRHLDGPLRRSTRRTTRSDRGEQPARGRIALTLGDPAGIGPELALMAWRAAGRRARPAAVLPDRRSRLHRAAGERLGLQVPIADVGPDLATEVFARALPVMPLPSGARVHAVAGRPDPANAGATLESITAAVDLVRSGAAAALVTNPIAKYVLTQVGFAHPGHTEFLAACAVEPGETPPLPVMMLWSETLAVVPVTIHVALRRVPDLLTQDLIVATARIVAADLRRPLRHRAAAPRRCPASTRMRARTAPWARRTATCSSPPCATAGRGHRHPRAPARPTPCSMRAPGRPTTWR